MTTTEPQFEKHRGITSIWRFFYIYLALSTFHIINLFTQQIFMGLVLVNSNETKHLIQTAPNTFFFWYFIFFLDCQPYEHMGTHSLTEAEFDI